MIRCILMSTDQIKFLLAHKILWITFSILEHLKLENKFWINENLMKNQLKWRRTHRSGDICKNSEVLTGADHRFVLENWLYLFWNFQKSNTVNVRKILGKFLGIGKLEKECVLTFVLSRFSFTLQPSPL